MINEQLVSYIRQQIHRGLSKEEIVQNLIKTGWQINDINEAFNIILNPGLQPQEQAPRAPISSLPGPIALLKESLVTYSQRFYTLIALAIVPVLFGYLVSFLVAALMALIIKIPIFVIILAFLLLFLLSVLIEAWVQLALIYAIKDSQEKIGIIESYRRAWPKIISYWWVVFLVGLIVAGGVFLFVIPGIIFSFWFSFAIFVLISENVTGMNALLKSRDYMKGKFWSVVWRVFVLGAISILFFLIINLVFSIHAISVAKPYVNDLVKLLLAPLSIIFSYLIFSKLREIKGEIVSDTSGGRKVKYIVVGIIGVLVGIALLFFLVFVQHSLGTARNKAQDASRQASLMQVRTMLEIYRMDSTDDKYPSSLDQLDEPLPVDPKTGLPYPFKYQALQGGQDFQICIKLSDGKDKCVTSVF